MKQVDIEIKSEGMIAFKKSLQYNKARNPTREKEKKMETEKIRERAQGCFDTLCKMLDERSFRYERDDENLCVRMGVRTDGLPLDIRFRVDTKRQLIVLLSPLPFHMNAERLADGAMAVAAINFQLADGSFDYHIKDGAVVFRVTSSFRDSVLGEKLFEYLLITAAQTVGRYSDQLLMLSKGRITLDEFMKDRK